MPEMTEGQKKMEALNEQAKQEAQARHAHDNDVVTPALNDDVDGLKQALDGIRTAIDNNLVTVKGDREAADNGLDGKTAARTLISDANDMKLELDKVDRGLKSVLNSSYDEHQETRAALVDFAKGIPSDDIKAAYTSDYDHSGIENSFKGVNNSVSHIDAKTASFDRNLENQAQGVENHAAKQAAHEQANAERHAERLARADAGREKAASDREASHAAAVERKAQRQADMVARNAASHEAAQARKAAPLSRKLADGPSASDDAQASNDGISLD